jgi:hypothetical protein
MGRRISNAQTAASPVRWLPFCPATARVSRVSLNKFQLKHPLSPCPQPHFATHANYLSQKRLGLFIFGCL